MSRYQIFARRQIRHSDTDLVSIGKMEGVNVISKTKTSIVAEMQAPLASRLAQKFHASLTLEAME